MSSVTILLFWPFIGAVAAFILGKANKKMAFWAAEIVGIALFAASLMLWINYTVPISIDYTWFTFGETALPFGIYIDGLSIVMLLIATGLGLLDIHFAHDYMGEDNDQARYYAKVLFFIGGMILLVIAKDMIGMFVGWEFMGLASYLLISFWHTKSAPANAGMQAFLYTRFGDVFIFAAIGLLLYFVGTLDLVEINTMAKEGSIDHSVALVIALFIFVGAIGKSGQFPLYPWLMNAMEGPTTVSALIHGATMVNSGIYIVARLFDFYASTEALLVVANVAALSAFIGATSALVQREIKKVLAYSTMSHLSLAFVGLGVGSLAAGMTHLMNHAVFKALLFLAAGAVIFAAHHTKDLWRFGGLGKKLTLIAAVMAIGGLSLSGIPPFSGFFSKDAVLASAMVNPDTQGLVSVLATIAGLLSIAYIGRVWLLLFTGKPRDEALYESVKKPSFLWITLPLVIMALITLGLGLYQSEAAEFITGEPYVQPHVDGLLIGLFIGLGLLALIVFGLYYKGLKLTEKISNHPFLKIFHQLLFNGYYVEYMITWFSKNIIVASVAKAATWIDLHIIDAIVNGSVGLTQALFKRLKVTQTGLIGDYAGMMVAGLAALTILMILMEGA